MGFKENTEKELKDLEQMVHNWKNYYVGEIDPTNPEYNKTLIEDFNEEISMYIQPYISHMKQFPENELTHEVESRFYHNISKHYQSLIWEIGKQEKCEDKILEIQEKKK